MGGTLLKGGRWGSAPRDGCAAHFYPPHSAMSGTVSTLYPSPPCCPPTRRGSSPPPYASAYHADPIWEALIENRSSDLLDANPYRYGPVQGDGPLVNKAHRTR